MWPYNVFRISIVRNFLNGKLRQTQKSQQWFKTQYFNTGRPMTEDQIRKKKIKSTLYYVSAAGVLTVGLSYAAVPLYRMFCQVSFPLNNANFYYIHIKYFLRPTVMVEQLVMTILK